MADALELRALWEAWQAEIRVPGSYCTDAYHALADAVFESLPGLLDELAEASKRPAKIIINLGLDPHYPCPDWDKRKSSVTDERGEKVGFVDSNDGMRVVVFVDGDAQTAQPTSDRSLEDAVAADLGLVTLDLPVGAVQLLYEVLGHFPHDPGSWSAVARRHCSIALMDARVDV